MDIHEQNQIFEQSRIPGFRPAELLLTSKLSKPVMSIFVVFIPTMEWWSLLVNLYNLCFSWVFTWTRIIDAQLNLWSEVHRRIILHHSYPEYSPEPWMYFICILSVFYHSSTSLSVFYQRCIFQIKSPSSSNIWRWYCSLKIPWMHEPYPVDSCSFIKVQA